MRAWRAARAGATLSSLVLLLGATDARAQNLVQNPGFTGGLAGWNVYPGQEYTVSWDGVEGKNAPGSVFLNVNNVPTGYNIILVGQCVPVTGSTTYDVGGSFRYPSSATATPVGSILLFFHSDGGCNSVFTGNSTFGLSDGTPLPNTWMTATYPGGFTPPAGIASVTF